MFRTRVRGCVPYSGRLGHVVERPEVEPGDQFVALEDVPRGAELHLQQPLLAGDRVEEPPLGLLRRGNFDDAAGVPVRLAEQVRRLLDAIDNVVEDAAVPAAGIAGAADALAGVPAAAVDFPGHFCRAADVDDFAVAFADGRRGGEIVDRPLHERSRRQHGGEHLAGVGSHEIPLSLRERVRVRGGGIRVSVSRSGSRTGSPHPDPLPTGEGDRFAIHFSSAIPLSARLFPTFRLGDNVLGSSRGDDAAALLARLRAEVDHPVGRLHDIEVVFDDDDGVAQIDEPVEHFEQLFQVGEVQSGGRLVEDVERSTGVGARQFRGEFHPLGLAAGERRRALAEGEIVQPHVAERVQHAANLRDVFEQPHRFAAGHVQHVGDRAAVELHGQRLLVVAAAAAGFALDPNVGKEVHFDPPLPVPFALLATPAGDVEAEPPRRVAPQLRLGKLGEERANQVEGPGEGGRVRGRRLSQRLLIDADHLVHQIDAADRVVGAGGRLARWSVRARAL